MEIFLRYKIVYRGVSFYLNSVFLYLYSRYKLSMWVLMFNLAFSTQTFLWIYYKKSFLIVATKFRKLYHTNIFVLVPFNIFYRCINRIHRYTKDITIFYNNDSHSVQVQFTSNIHTVHIYVWFVVGVINKKTNWILFLQKKKSHSFDWHTFP